MLPPAPNSKGLTLLLCLAVNRNPRARKILFQLRSCSCAEVSRFGFFSLHQQAGEEGEKQQTKMKYISTRDSSICSSFEQALISGYAPDGGLFVPQSLPYLSIDELESFSALTFPELAYAILCKFISPDEVPSADLRDICQNSFHDGFDAECVVPIVKIGDSSTFVAELFHGPTMCFKDLGMQGVIHLLAYFSAKRNRKACLLAATTGDTGPAAVQAVKQCNSPYLSCVIHYPKGQISEFQRRQMTTANSPKVKIVSFVGGGDDMDKPIKELLAEQERKGTPEDPSHEVFLCGVNSYNIGRPVMQMAHFFWTYLRVCDQCGTKPGNLTLDLVIPAGALGNATAANLAKKMGVPFGRICLGTNVNDISHRVVTTGEFHRADEMKPTLSEAINIQVPYNFERVLYFLSGCDDVLIRDLMTKMDSTGKIDLERELLEKLQAEFASARITDDEMCSAMVNAKEKLEYFIDPHTAVAFAAADKLGYMYTPFTTEGSSNGASVAIMATASPCKFKEAVTEALGVDGWNEYMSSRLFPKRASEYMAKVETPPVEYTRAAGISLGEAQEEWKWKTLAIANDM